MVDIVKHAGTVLGTIIGITLALFFNAGLAALIFWASNTLFGTTIALNTQNLAAGSVLLTIINLIIKEHRGESDE